MVSVSFRRSSGFTTVEMIAVLLILAVLGAVVVGRAIGTGTTGYNVQSVAEELKNHLRFAQTRAMSSNVVWGVFFISTSQYTLFRNGSTTAGNLVTPPGADSSTVNLTTRGVSLGGIAAGDVVAFDDWGKPYTDAAATSAQSGTKPITVTGGGQTVTIQITQNTGYIP